MAAPSDREMMRFQRESLAQMLKINASLAGLQMGSNIGKAMGAVPGGRTISDYFDVRKRMKFEDTGRDSSGRKLTKRELEDRDAQRKATFAMGTILEIFQDEWGFKRGGDGAVPVEFTDKGLKQFKDMFSGLDGLAERMGDLSKVAVGMAAEVGRNTKFLENMYPKEFYPDLYPAASTPAAAPLEEDGSADELAKLRAEEAEAERKAEEERKAAEEEAASRKKSSFLEKLLKKKDGTDSALGGLMSAVMPFLSIFKGGGGLKGIFTRLIGVLLPVLGKMTAAVVGFVGGLLPALVPIALAGAAGYAIKKWIDDMTDERKRAGGERMAQGFKTKYAVKDESGKTTLKTAEELGTTDQAMFEAQDDEGNIRLTEGQYKGQTVSGKGIPMLTQGGAMTDMLHGSADEEQKRMYRDIMGRAAMGAGARKEFREQEGFLKSNKWLENSLSDLNDDMSRYSDLFAHNIGNIQDEATGKNLSDEWNKVRNAAKKIMETAKFMGTDVEGAASRLLDAVTNQHGPFEDLYSMEEGFAKGDATYNSGGLMLKARLNFPSVTKGKRKPRKWYESNLMGEVVRADDSTRFSHVLGNQPEEELGEPLAPTTGSIGQTMTPIPTMGSNASAVMKENSVLRDEDHAPPLRRQQPIVSDNRVSNNTNMLSAHSARLGGANTTTTFNGIRIAFA